MEISFKKWFEAHFQNYYGPVVGTGQNDELFQARGVKSKYAATSKKPYFITRRKFADCLFLGKNCKG